MRSPQLWLVNYTVRKQKAQMTSPPLKYKWEVWMWLKQFKPEAEITSIEPHRPMAVKR